MVPTLRDGDRLLVLRWWRPRTGAVVLARYHSMPERHVVKRLGRCTPDGWLLASDNPFAGGDSRSHGPARVIGRVILHRAPGSLRPRWVPRAVAASATGETRA